MKQYILRSCVLACLCCLLYPSGYAQNKEKNYTVYSVIGDVYLTYGQKKSRVKPRLSIKSSDVVIASKGSALNLLDEEKSILYSLAPVGKSSMSNILARQKSASKSLTKQYLSYLMKKLFSKESQNMIHPDCYMQITGTSYRSEGTDSIFLSSVWNKFDNSENQFEQTACQSNVFPQTDYDVTFSIVSCETGLPIDKDVRTNESCYVRVNNKTLIPLYVNVLNIDAEGKKYLLLPMDEAATCAHLLVPGQSEVDFKSEPFIFDGNPSDETFLLFAVDSPVDFSILLNPITKDAKQRNPMAVGVFKKMVKVN
jgi:hypothetical protein